MSSVGDFERYLELPNVIDSTVAADSIRSQREPLLNLISHCLSSLANSLLAKSIIPRDVYKKVCNPFLEDNERGGALLDCVETSIRLKVSCFATFIGILKSEPFLSSQAEKLVQSYCTLSSISITKCQAIISPAISQYAAYLKGVYRNSPISPDSKWPPTPSKKYIKLATVEHGYKCRDEFIGDTLHGNIKEVLESRKEISIDEILVPDEKSVAYLKLVIIEGAPGIGKSTLAWELCRRWEHGSMEEFSLTVLLRLREKRVQEVNSIAELFYSCPSKYKDVLLDEVSSSNGKGVLFILDGFDELPTTLQKEGFLIDLIRGTFLPECTVLVTSRPSATAELLTICRPQVQKHVEVLGFTQESVEEYATSIFSSEPKRLQKFKAFVSASGNPAINSLMYVPLNAAIIVEIYRHSKSDHLLPHTLTQVYTQLCLTILNRYLHTSFHSVRVNKFKDLPCHLYQEFLKLSEIAFDGMRRQEVIFHTLPSDLVHFGFLDAVSSLYGGGNVSYNFLHFTLQEFFAAYHISQLCGGTRLALLKECGSDESWNVVWRFVAGLTEFKFFEGHLKSDLFVEESKEDEVEVKLLFVQCLFEANNKMVSSEFFGLKSIMPSLEFFFRAQPLDLYALGYCIAHLTSEVSWNLLGIKRSLFPFLADGLKTCETISNNSNVKRLSMSSLSHLKHFPLRGISDLTLDDCEFHSFNHHIRLIPLMTSLKRLSIHNSISDSHCIDEFLWQLSHTNVTSLNIEGTDLTKSVSALQPLIDPLTGTLEGLHAGGNVFYLIDDTTLLVEDTYDDAAFLDVVCATSSLKSLNLVNPHNISSLAQLQLNTHLTKLEIEHDKKISEAIEIIVGIVEINKMLEQLIVGTFKLPEDHNTLRDIVEALPRNSTLKSIAIRINYSDEDISDVYNYIEIFYPDLYVSDTRLSWQ